jgi:hypothetical protein
MNIAGLNVRSEMTGNQAGHALDHIDDAQRAGENYGQNQAESQSRRTYSNLDRSWINEVYLSPNIQRTYL